MRIMSPSGEAVPEHQLLELLAEEGIAFLSETDCDEITTAFGGLLDIYRHTDATSSAWTLIQPYFEGRQGAGLDGFTNAALGLHTDRSMLDAPPSILCYLMLAEAESGGGDSILFDTEPLLSRYDRNSLLFIENTLWLHSRVQGWRQRVLTVARDGRVIIRFRDDDVAQPKKSAALPEALLRGIRDPREGMYKIRLHAGEGYVVHNHRILHGRTSFQGHRKGARFLFYVKDGSSFDYLNRGFVIGRQGNKRKGGV
ncbi:TauD/TfdA family dioxygenase [Streptomyces sp. bgisy032]|uniref:TauD/TfdA family dioxygenase n=1 Tax=Streptomyces sp. bgisy032 TaxID=3413773 RepID=UPI003D7563ED